MHLKMPIKLPYAVRAAFIVFLGSGLIVMALIYNYDRVDRIFATLDARQTKTCHVVRMRAIEDEKLQDTEAYSSTVLANFVAPHSKLIQDTLRNLARAQAHRARVAKVLEKETGC